MTNRTLMFVCARCGFTGAIGTESPPGDQDVEGLDALADSPERESVCSNCLVDEDEIVGQVFADHLLEESVTSFAVVTPPRGRAREGEVPE